MKKILILVTFFLFTTSMFGQEDKTVTARLKEKYGWACYHDTNGGWYSIKKGDYHSIGNEGACDLRGHEVIPPIWDDVNYGGTYYKVKKNGKVGIRGLKNEEILPISKYDDIHYYQMKDHGFCEVIIGTKVGAIDKQGKEVIPCEYDDISIWEIKEYEYGGCRVKSNGMKGIYDIRSKKLLIPCKFGEIRSWQLKDGDYCCVLKYEDEYEKENPNNRIGVIDKQGNEILPSVYTSVSLWNNVAAVGKDGSYKKYDQGMSSNYALYNLEKKKFVTEFKYGYIGYYPKEEGLVSFNVGGKVAAYTDNKPDVKGGKWGYMDSNGKEIIPAQYDIAGDFNDGVAQVTKNGVTSLLTNPIMGTKLQMADGQSLNEVDRNIPQTNRNDENLFAFIFANENYMHLKGADWAINDGKVFGEYCRKTIGVPMQNVRYYEDATYGNIIGAVKKIKDIAEVYEGEAKIIIYFSGLGATDNQTHERYLLASDASLESLKSTGYAVSELQKDLNELKTAYTLVILDAPFSNVDRTNHPLSSNRGIRIAPKKISPSGSVKLFTGCNEDETSFSSNDYKHGMFTYALLKQLQTSKGNCTLGEMMDKASTWVRKESVSKYDKVQSPQKSISNDMEKKLNNLLF